MALHNVTFTKALEELADMYDIDYEGNEEYQRAKSYFEEQYDLCESFKRHVDLAKTYLTEKRGLSEDTIEAFGYGFNEERGSITIPIRNADGMYVAHAERNFRDGVPKYVNDRNNEYYAKGDLLYNFDRARKIMHKQGRIYLCEGYFDVASADNQGLPCVGYTGATLTQNHIRLLAKELQEYDKKFTVMLAPDNDEAGQGRIEQLRDKFKQYGSNLNVRIVKIPDGYKDFSDLHVAGLNISDLPSEHIDVLCCVRGIEKCPDRETEYQFALDYLNTVANPLIRTEIAEKLAVRWGKDTKDIIGIANGTRTETSFVNDFKSPLQCVSEFRELMSNGSIGTGFPDLDESTSKLLKSEVVMVAAYSGVGKTFTAIQIALHAAFREKKNVIFFSMEMSAATLITRLIAMFMRKREDEVKELLMNGDNMALTVQRALNKKLLIVDKNNLTVDDIRTYINVANTMVFDTPTDMIILDYLQYMPGTSEYTVMSETVRSFKPLAKEMNVVPVILSQLNREGKPWEKPDLTQMKGGGDIEATADWIIGMWRDGENPSLSLEEQARLQDCVNIAILKGRRRYGQRDFCYRFDADETNFKMV
jgi:KaiC/GvpD/RAD55 family RecA-like ATPase